MVECSEMFASLAGQYLDLRAIPNHPILDVNTTAGYPAGNALANKFRAAGVNGIIYPSVRHAGGVCIAALFPHAVQSVVQGAVYRISWSGSPTPAVVHV